MKRERAKLKLMTGDSGSQLLMREEQRHWKGLGVDDRQGEVILVLELSRVKLSRSFLVEVVVRPTKS